MSREPEMTARTDPAAKTPTEIGEALFEESARLTDAQLLVLVLGMGNPRQRKGQVKKTWTAIGLANELLVAARRSAGRAGAVRCLA